MFDKLNIDTVIDHLQFEFVYILKSKLIANFTT